MSLASLEFELQSAGDGKWTVRSKSSKLIPVTAEVTADPKIVAMAQPYHDATERFLNTPIAAEAILATGDLGFAALGAQKLYAGCPAGHEVFEQMLNDAGFMEVIPAGSLDQTTHRPRRSALFEMRREDWKAIRREYTDHTGAPSLASLGTAQTHHPVLELL